MNYEGLTDRELWQLLFQKTEAEMAVYMRGLDQLPRSELIMAADEISAMMTCHSELMAFGENLSRKKMIFLLQQETVRSSSRMPRMSSDSCLMIHGSNNFYLALYEGR